MQDPKTSKYHIGGFSRMTQRPIQFVVMASLASYPSEALLQALLADDRVCLRRMELEVALIEEMHWAAPYPSRSVEPVGQCSWHLSGRLAE
jgi:hypothetical protein